MNAPLQSIYAAPCKDNAVVIRYSRGLTKWDNRPEQRSAGSFLEFAEAVLSDRAKGKGQYFITSAFAEGLHSQPDKHGGKATWRQKHLALPRAFLPFDFDGFDTPETFSILKAWLSERYPHFGYTTASSTPEAPRARAIVGVSREMTPDECVLVCRAIQGEMEGHVGKGRIKFDESVYQPAQPIYTPVTFSQSFGAYDPRLHSVPALIDVDAVLAKAKSVEVELGRHAASYSSHESSISDHRNPEEWLADLLNGEDVHGNTLRVVGRLVALGMDDAPIRALFGVFAEKVEKARGAERARCLVGAELDDIIRGARAKGYAPADPGQAAAELMRRIEATDPADINLHYVIDDLLACISKSNLKPVPVDALLRAMGHRFKVSMSALRQQLRQAKDKDSPDHRDLALRVLDQIGRENVIFTQSFFWQWDASGVWRKLDDREMKHTVQNILGSTGEIDLTRSVVDSVTDLLGTEINRNDSPFDKHNWTLVNCKNGTLEWSGDEWTLRPHKREDYLTVMLPIPYDVYASAPRFEQFLSEVFEGDPDALQKATCIKEAIGYTMLTTCRFEKFFLLIGKGANGKSVLLSVVEELLGKNLVCAVQPAQFERPFQRAHLHGKLANIVTEIAEGAEIQDAQLKAITSGELTTAEHKNKNPFNFRPFSTCWFGTNHMPHTRDFSDALFRRAVVLTFNRKFVEGDNADPHLKEKLTSELAGILASSLTAIGGALRRGAFTIPKSSAEAAKEWRTNTDQVAQFFEDECVPARDHELLSSAVFSAYRAWADSTGVRNTLSQKSLTERLIRAGLAEKKRTSAGRFLVGFRLARRLTA
jgi:putative DNA primase/helicase